MAFETGKSGNPHGRPKGSGYRQQIFNDLVLPHKEVLLEKAINMAKDGDPQMLRLFLERLLPAKPADEPVNLDIPGDLTLEAAINLGKNILHLLAQKEITPKQANSLYAVLKFYQENIAAHELLEDYKRLIKNFENFKNQPFISTTTSK
ncbi:MAG: DUF5681 domain-containing protein [Gammaproteobacteria bacterium]